MIEEENGEVRRNEGMKGERLDRGIASLLKVFGLTKATWLCFLELCNSLK